ncbi:MAG TPA: chemotaxis protein CheW [Candidatus Latescibacteria bacterium]|nr:chemotaxis protein CheW [Candidatus Latescibacterota bacterium]
MDQSEEMLELVGFKLEGEEFGVPIQSVREIIRMQNVTRVPHAPEFVEGVINLRGQVVPIVDLRKRLGMPPKESDRLTRIIIVEPDGELAGFIVDSVTEVLRLRGDQIEPPPEMAVRVEQRYITAVGKLDDRLLILLDLQQILSPEEREQVRSSRLNKLDRKREVQI